MIFLRVTEHGKFGFSVVTKNSNSDASKENYQWTSKPQLYCICCFRTKTYPTRKPLRDSILQLTPTRELMNFCNLLLLYSTSRDRLLTLCCFEDCNVSLIMPKKTDDTFPCTRYFSTRLFGFFFFFFLSLSLSFFTFGDCLVRARL